MHYLAVPGTASTLRNSEWQLIIDECQPEIGVRCLAAHRGAGGGALGDGDDRSLLHDCHFSSGTPDKGDLRCGDLLGRLRGRLLSGEEAPATS